MTMSSINSPQSSQTFNANVFLSVGEISPLLKDFSFELTPFSKQMEKAALTCRAIACSQCQDDRSGIAEIRMDFIQIALLHTTYFDSSVATLLLEDSLGLTVCL